MSLYVVSVDQIALAAATAKSVLELLTTTTDKIRIKEWWVEFDGVNSAAVPVKVEIGRFSAGVTTATAVTPGKFEPSEGSASITAKHSATVEGAGVISDGKTHRVSPTSGLWYVAPLGQEYNVAVSSFWRMRLTAAAAVNATVGVIWDE